MGKSTLLKAVGWGLVVGFPKSLRCLYVDQLEGVDPEQSPVEVVVAADSEAQRAQREAAALQAALEGGEPGGMARTLRQLAVARAEEEAAGAAQTAERRSGERGLAARQALVGAEAALAEARARLDAPLSAQEEAAAQAAAQVRSGGVVGGAPGSGRQQACADACPEGCTRRAPFSIPPPLRLHPFLSPSCHLLLSFRTSSSICLTGWRCGSRRRQRRRRAAS